MKPARIQLSRAKGFRLQEVSKALNGLPAVSVSRPGTFGNPFTMDGCREAGFRGTDKEIARRCVEAFRAWLVSSSWRINWDGPEAEAARAAILSGLPGLKGRNLACWCKPGEPCHAEVLLEIANSAKEG